jgi:hypothetical protein
VSIILSLAISIFGVQLGFAADFRQCSYSCYAVDSFGYAQGSAGVQQVEQVACLHALIIGGKRQLQFCESKAFLFSVLEMALQIFDVGVFEGIFGKFHFLLEANISVGDFFDAIFAVPIEIKDIIDFLEKHGKSFESVGELHGYGTAIESSHLLKIGKLRDFHAVAPDFPSETGGSQSRTFPVIFHKTNVMASVVYAQNFEAFQVDVLYVVRGWLDHHLKLMMLVNAVGILAVSPVRRTSRWLHVGCFPAAVSQSTQECIGAECACPNLQVIGLQNSASVGTPVAAKQKNYFLKAFHENSPKKHWDFDILPDPICDFLLQYIRLTELYFSPWKKATAIDSQDSPTN